MALNDSIVEIIQQFGDDLKKDIAKSYIKKGHAGKANQGAQVSVFPDSGFIVLKKAATGLTLQVNLNDFWTFINYGTKPSKFGSSSRKGIKRGSGKEDSPFIKQLMDWLAHKQINAMQVYKSKLKTGRTSISYKQAERGLAHAIRKSIYRKGIIKRFGHRGSGFLSDVMKDGRLEKLSQSLSQAMGREILIEFKEAFQ